MSSNDEHIILDPDPTAKRPSAGLSLGEIFAKISQSLSTLLRDEINLMKAQATDKAGKMGKGIGMFAAAGVLALFAFGILLLAAVWGIAVALPLWLSALIVGVALLLIVGILALVGKKSLDKAKKVAVTPPDVKADVNAVKEGLSSE